jgi:hypothetical protein
MNYYEAMQALECGKAVRPVVWPSNSKLFQTAKGVLMAQTGCNPPFQFTPFGFIFTPNFCKWELV